MSAQPSPAGFETPFIDEPLATLGAWTACFDPGQLPVLEQSALALEDLRSHEDDVDAHLLAEAFSSDPLMMIKTMSHVAGLRGRREGSDPETMTAALVMMGITPFFRDFGPQRSVESVLVQVPGALDGFMQVLRRSHRAARFALAFAVQRIDHDAGLIHDAALLHDFAELLMWLRAPGLALEVLRRLRADPGLRSARAQREVFNIELPDLQHALMVQWRLPSMLTAIADDHRAQQSAQSRTVVLAIRLARHTAVDWTNPALADDVNDIAELLHLGVEPTLALLQDVDSGV